MFGQSMLFYKLGLDRVSIPLLNPELPPEGVVDALAGFFLVYTPIDHHGSIRVQWWKVVRPPLSPQGFFVFVLKKISSALYTRMVSGATVRGEWYVPLPGGCHPPDKL